MRSQFPSLSRQFLKARGVQEQIIGDFSNFANLTVVGCWGTVRRVGSYSGPALRIRDGAAGGDETDVYFDSNGHLSSAPAYGGSTQVVKIYDQSGNGDHLALTGSVGPAVDFPSGTRLTWDILFNHDYDFVSTNDASTAAWAIPKGAWAWEHNRSIDRGNNLQVQWAVAPASGQYMGIGLWAEADDLHWRVNGGGPSDWTGTDFDAYTGQYHVAFGDLTQEDGNAYGYFNGVLSATYAYTAPIALTGTLGLANGVVGEGFSGRFNCLTIWSSTAAISTADRNTVLAAQDGLAVA